MVGLSKGMLALPLEGYERRLAGEQREVTVAFADIRGFTTLADCIPPDELVAVLNIYLVTIINVFRKHEGLINKFGGDSVMAVWNAPIDCQEHALLATVAAIGAQRAVSELKRKQPTLPKINFGIGINTGKVIAGSIGCPDCMEYTVIGDTVNIAARLTSVVLGGKVWITTSTSELVQDYISVKPLESLEVKGKRQPVKVYEVEDLNTASAQAFDNERLRERVRRGG